jgi:hypothetical protein
VQPLQQAKKGDYRQAAATSQTLAGHPANLPLHYYCAACTYALWAAAAAKDAQAARDDRNKPEDDYAARAIEMLNRAAAGGFLKDPYQFAEFQKDSE